MYLFKYSILVLLLSLSFSQKNSLSDNNVKSKNNTNIEKVKSDPIKISHLGISITPSID